VKVLFLGDLKSDSGPAIVNKNLIRCFDKKKVITINSQNKIKKIIVAFKNLKQVDLVVISGINFGIPFLISFIYKIVGKKIIYVAHGLIKIEKNYRNTKLIESFLEIYYLTISNKIVCVSRNFMEIVSENYKNLKNKLSYINNGVSNDINIHKESNIISPTQRLNILTLGGGRPEKGVKLICESLEKLNDNFKLIVIGEDGKDTLEIKKYKFVEYLGKVSHTQVINYMQQSSIFIQNSISESFGMAPLEALINKNSIIVSNKVGMISIFKQVPPNTIVKYGDKEELYKTVKYRIAHSNNKELIDNIDIEDISWNKVAERYIKLFEKIINDN
jgi:glycosyltransferase involved in cell wall biosynthesis